MPGMRSTPFFLLKELTRPGKIPQSTSFQPSSRLRGFASQPFLHRPNQQSQVKGKAFVCLFCQLRAHSRLYSTQNGKTETGFAKKDTPRRGENAAAENGSESAKISPVPSTDGLPSQEERLRSTLSKKFGELMDNMQSNIFVAGRHLNDLTGYTAIEKLKKNIRTQEERVRQARADVRNAKEAYSAAINCRSTSQREVNELLQRKHAWSPSDLERFTSLYRSDHANERAEIETQEALSNAEREAEEATSHLSKNILTRYHEEQVWSDKIRRMSTWGTWGLMGVNVLLFLIFQIAVEPWRRRRLVKGFEEKVVEALAKGENRSIEQSSPAIDKEQAHLDTSKVSQVDNVTASEPPESMDGIEPVAEQTAKEVEPSEAEAVGDAQVLNPELSPLTSILPPDLDLDPKSWGKTAQAFFTERRITLSQRDLTTVALESAAVGAAVMGGVLIAIFRLG